MPSTVSVQTRCSDPVEYQAKWGEQHAGRVQQRVVGRRRLGRQDVEPGPREPPVAQRLRERLLVDEAPARDVHQQRRRLHPRERVRVDQPLRVVGQREVQRDDVAAGEQLADLADAAHARQLDVRPRVVGEQLAHERREACRDRLPDPPATPTIPTVCSESGATGASARQSVQSARTTASPCTSLRLSPSASASVWVATSSTQ